MQFKFVVAPGVPSTTAADDDELIAVSNGNGKQATVTFMPPLATSADGQEAIAGYQVYVKGGKRRRRRRAGKWKAKWMVSQALAVDTTPTATTITITGLQPDEKYKFRLRAFSTASGHHFGEWSEESNSIYTVPAVPEKISYFWWNPAETADDYAFLEWLTPESSGLDYDLTHFALQYKISGASSYTTVNIYPRTNQDVNQPDELVEEWVNGLSASTTYAMNIAACNELGCGTVTSDISVTTNSTAYERIYYAVQTNISFASQWCTGANYGIDCGNWITPDSWGGDIETCFINSLVYWLQWHSTYLIEYTYANTGYSAVAPTPAPSAGAVTSTTLANNNVSKVDQDDWETTTTTGCEGGAETGCYQPTAMPTQKPVTQLSTDGYYNDPGALNGSATGNKALTGSNVSVNVEVDCTFIEHVDPNFCEDGSDAVDCTWTTNAPTPAPTPVPGTTVDYTTNTGTGDQADTVLQVVTENEDEDTNDNPDSESFSQSFTTTADTTYSA
jgi:hypothetical protein